MKFLVCTIGTIAGAFAGYFLAREITARTLGYTISLPSKGVVKGNTIDFTGGFVATGTNPTDASTGSAEFGG